MRNFFFVFFSTIQLQWLPIAASSSPNADLEILAKNCANFLPSSYTPNCPYGNMRYNNSDQSKCDLLEIEINFQPNFVEFFDDRTESFGMAGEMSIWWYPMCSMANFTLPIVGDYFANIEKWWKPSVYHQNSADDYKMKHKAYRFFYMNVPTLPFQHEFFWQIIGSFSSHCDLNLANFPFDTQNCSVDFVIQENPNVLNFKAVTSWDTGTTSNSFVKFESLTSTTFGWKVIGRSIEYGQFYNSGKKRFLSKFGFVFQRKPEFYVFNMLIPTALLSILNVFVFALKPDKPERSALSFAILLALVLLRGEIVDKVPENSADSFLTNYTNLSAVFSWFFTVYFLLIYFAFNLKSIVKYLTNNNANLNDVSVVILRKKQKSQKRRRLLMIVDVCLWLFSFLALTIFNIVKISTVLQM